MRIMTLLCLSRRPAWSAVPECITGNPALRLHFLKLVITYGGCTESQARPGMPWGKPAKAYRGSRHPVFLGLARVRRATGAFRIACLIYAVLQYDRNPSQYIAIEDM